MQVSHPPASRRVFVGLVVALLFGMNVSGQTASQVSPADTREPRWQQDLDYFANRFPQDEKDFPKLYPKQEFQSQLATIRQSVPKASDAEIVLDLMRLVASAHVAHTRVEPPYGHIIHFLPLSMHWYSDGLAITAADDAYKDTLGTRVVRIGTMTPQQLEMAVAPYISFEMDASLHVRSPWFMTMIELLQHLGLTETDGSVEFRLSGPDGTESTKKISPPAAGHAARQIGMYQALHLPVPLSRKQPGKYYWYEYLSDSQTLYIQYNACVNDPKLRFADFTKAMFSYVDAQPVQRVIVDLRFNSGGNSLLNRHLIGGLHHREALSRRGRLYTLIGPGTFSSALMAARDLQDLHAIFIGEPLAEKLNSYGDIRPLTLPNSRVIVYYSKRFIKLGKKNDGPTLMPEILAPEPSLVNALAGRDPALEAALQHPLK